MARGGAWGTRPPAHQSAAPGPMWPQLAGDGAAAPSKQPFALAFYPVGLEGRKSGGQLPITCFQAPTSPRKWPSQLHS